MQALHQALRDATRDAHVRVEAAMGLDPEALTLGRYVRGLQVLHAARATWEPEIEALLPGSTGPHLAWLEQDLSGLGSVAQSPAPPLGLTSEGEAWGARYVLEGSALGSRVLVRAAARLGVTPDRGSRYFAGHSDRAGVVWKTFLADLARADAPGAVSGATRAFGALAQLAESR